MEEEHRAQGVLAGKGLSLPVEGRGSRPCLAVQRGAGFQVAMLGAHSSPS